MTDFVTNRLRPLLLLPMSEWKMRPVKDGIGDKVGIGIYATLGDDGSYTRTWFKWPWSCIPNNIIGFDDLVRCGVAEDLMAHLTQQEAAFAALKPSVAVQADPA